MKPSQNSHWWNFFMASAQVIQDAVNFIKFLGGQSRIGVRGSVCGRIGGDIGSHKLCKESAGWYCLSEGDSAMLNTLNAVFPIRYTVMGLSVFALLLSVFSLLVFGAGFGTFLLAAILVGVGVYDLRQTKRSILRNYPIIGHLRFMLEFVRQKSGSTSSRATTEATPFSPLPALTRLPAGQGRA